MAQAANAPSGRTAHLRRLFVAGAMGVGAVTSALQPLAVTLDAQALRSSSTNSDGAGSSKRSGNAKSGKRSGKQGQPARVNDHRFRYMLTGAAIGSALAYAYYQVSEHGNGAGRCQPARCALPYLAISGGITGLFMAQELAAQRRAEAPRAGTALQFSFNEVGLPAAATAIGVRDSIVVAATDSGAMVTTGGPRPAAVRRRGAGLSNLRSVAVSGSEPKLIIGTGTALWETPLTTGLLTRVMEGPVDALSASSDNVVAAFGSKVRVRHTVGGAQRIDSIEAPAPITSTRFDATSGRYWMTTDSALFELAVTDGAPALTQRAKFSGVARAVASSANWVAVALGSDGLAIWPRTSLGSGGVTTPITLRNEPRFAFDLAFVGDRLFVAGGVDGVTQVELVPSPRIVGSSRQAGYATSITSENGVLWVSDRNGNRVLRIVP